MSEAGPIKKSYLTDTVRLAEKTIKVQPFLILIYHLSDIFDHFVLRSTEPHSQEGDTSGKVWGQKGKMLCGNKGKSVRSIPVGPKGSRASWRRS